MSSPISQSTYIDGPVLFLPQSSTALTARVVIQIILSANELYACVLKGVKGTAQVQLHICILKGFTDRVPPLSHL